MGNGEAAAAAPTPATFYCCCCFKKFKVLFCAGAKDCTQIQECSSAPGSLVSGLALIAMKNSIRAASRGEKKKNSPTFTLPHTGTHCVCASIKITLGNTCPLQALTVCILL